MTAALHGLFIGVLFGFALQRGRFCMNSAIRDTILLKDNTLLKAVSAAILTAMAGFALLELAGLIKMSPSAFFWGAHLVGGTLFGIGMVLAGGCASGVTYRVGEGVVGAMAAAVGLATAASFTVFGFLAPIKDYLQKNTKIMAGEANPTLANIFGLPHWVVAFAIVIIAVVAGVIIAGKNKEAAEAKSTASLITRIFKKGWGWLAAGIVVGLINILAFYTSTLAGRSYPLGITSGWVGIVKVLTGYEQVVDGVAKAYTLGWGDYLIIGIVLGALIAALLAFEFKLRWPGWKPIGQTFGGGLLMGFGAITSGGCNVGHILSGLPQLGIGSIVGSISIVIGAWLMAYLMFVRPQTA